MWNKTTVIKVIILSEYIIKGQRLLFFIFSYLPTLTGVYILPLSTQWNKASSNDFESGTIIPLHFQPKNATAMLYLNVRGFCVSRISNLTMQKKQLFFI